MPNTGRQNIYRRTKSELSAQQKIHSGTRALTSLPTATSVRSPHQLRSQCNVSGQQGVGGGPVRAKISTSSGQVLQGGCSLVHFARLPRWQRTLRLPLQLCLVL